MAAFLLNSTIFLGEGGMSGSLYLISWYPGAIYSSTTKEVVKGDLFEIDEQVNFEKFFSTLDEYEGFDKLNTDDSEFIRVQAPVLFKNKEYMSWVYLYNKEVSLSNKIDFFNVD